jgi:hypothetical protein
MAGPAIYGQADDDDMYTGSTGSDADAAETDAQTPQQQAHINLVLANVGDELAYCAAAAGTGLARQPAAANGGPPQAAYASMPLLLFDLNGELPELVHSSLCAWTWHEHRRACATRTLTGVLVLKLVSKDGHQVSHRLRPGVEHLLRLLPHFQLGIFSSATEPTVRAALTAIVAALRQHAEAEGTRIGANSFS